MEAWTPDSELTAPPPVLLHTLSVQRGKRRHTATWGPSSHRTPGLTRRRQGPPSVVAWRCPSPRTPVSLRDTCRTESRATRQPCPCTGPEGTGASAGLGRKARCSWSRYLGEGRTGCGAVSPPIWGARLSSSGGSRRPAEKTGFVGRTLRPLCRDSAPALDVCAVTSDERPQEHTVHVENPCTRNAALPTTPPALGLL